MSLITPEELAAAVNMERAPGLVRILMDATRLNRVNEVFEEAQDLTGLTFVDKVLEILGVDFEISDSDLKKIPASGPFVAVANHPYGGIEGLILLKLLCMVRPDTRLMVNFILSKIPNLREYFIPVNPFEDLKSKSSLAGIKQILNLLEEGHPIGIFPAGEVSTFHVKTQRVTDKAWHPVVGKIIRKSNVPVLPVYFKGNNGLLFQTLSLIHPKLRTAKLPSEIFNKTGKTIKVRIGFPVGQKELDHFKSSESALNFVRSRTYALEMGYESLPGLFNAANIFKIHKIPKKIIDPIPLDKLQKEIESLENNLISSEGPYSVFLVPYFKIPNILLEIGRLREVTFREVGEGTGKHIDLDQYDTYYHHLLIWHKEENCIVGAYRMGLGKEILQNRGMKGFYVNELFRVEPGFRPVMEAGVEVGRSWIRKEFQNKHLPLFLLWRGLLTYILNNPQLKYLFGPVSISNDYSELSKALIVEYVRKNHFDNELARYVRPRKEYKYKSFSNIDLETLSGFGDNSKTLDTIIADVDRVQNRMPVLIRQYLNLNGKIAAFNVDPKFSDCIDGFLVLDVSNVPQSMLEKLKPKS